MSTRALAAPAGSRRFWITVVIFALLNAGFWVGYHRWQSQRMRLLEVRQFSPGDGAQVEGTPALVWSFNLDVIPPAGDAPPVKFNPPLSGKFQWTDRRTLVFTPKDPLRRATNFVATMPTDALRTPEGFGLSRAGTFAFHTPPQTLIAVRQAAVDESDRVILELQFSEKTLPADVSAHLSIYGPHHDLIHFQPHGNAAGNSVRVITDSVRNLLNQPEPAFLDVRISKGLAGADGPLAMEEDATQRITIAADVFATEATAYSPANGEPTVNVRFNNEVNAESIRDAISTEPPVPVTITSSYSGIALHGPFEPGIRYAIKIGKSTGHAKGRKPPRPATLSVVVPDRNPSIWFDHPEGYLSAAGNRTLLAHVVNFTDLRVLVTRVYDNNLVDWRNSVQRQHWIDPQSFGRPIASRDLRVNSEKNKAQDVRISLDELLGDGLHDGVYQVAVVATRPGTVARHHARYDVDDEEDGGYDARAQTLVTLSDIALTAKSGRDGVTVWATSLRTARPLADARIRLFSNKSQPLGEALTNADGLAKITGFTPAPGEQPTVLLADLRSSVSPSPGTPGEGWGGGLSKAASFGETPNLTLPRSTGRGNGEDEVSTRAPTTQPIAHSLTWLDLRSSGLSTGDLDLGGRAYLRGGFEAFVYTDRGVYRPGETVHLRAIVRGPDQLMPPAFPVRWQLRRPDLHNWKAQVVQLDADGAASMDLQIPDDLPTGRWTAEIGLPSDDRRGEKTFGSTTFLIEEFMPQRMKVALKLGDSDAPRISANDQTIPVRVQADYLFGRPAEGQAITVAARIDPAIFAPTAFKGWNFGDTADALPALGSAKPLGRRMDLAGADLNPKGQAKWDLDLNDLLENGEKADEQQARQSPKRVSRKAKKQQAAKPEDTEEDFAGPWKLTVSASIMETGGRAVSATQQVDVDRVPYYVGLRLRDSSPKPGMPATYDVRLVTPAGAIAQVDQPLEATLYRESWNSSYVYEEGRYHYSSTRLLEPLSKEPHTVKISAGVGEGAVTIPQTGSYVLLLRDPQTQCIASCPIACWYGSWEDNISRDNPQRLEVSVQPLALATFDDFLAKPDKLDLAGWIDQFAAASKNMPADRIRIGQRAQVVVRSPFAGRLLLAVETDGVLSTRVIDMPSTHIVVPIDVTEACRPNAYVTATVIRGVEPNAKWSTHRAFGATRMTVDDSDRRLKVELAAPKEIRPATSLHADLRVTDDGGAPIPNAAVTVAAVDEGICLLTNFQTPDPLKFFTANRALGVHWADAFDQLIPEIAAAQSAVGGDESASIGHQNPVSAKRVKPVALFSGVLHTDANGIAHADFNVPQFTGQLRLMAVASAERRFGSDQATVLVRSPLLVQSSWPRFAAPGDRFSVAMDVFNNSSVAGEATVTIELDEGPLRFTDGTRSRTLPISLRASAHAPAHIDVIADDRAGVARAHLIAHFGAESFEENLELPVRPASPPIAVGGYLTTSPGAAALISLPQGMLPGSGKFELRISPQPQLQIPEGLDYLDRYPYGCLEQTTSTLFPLVYLPDIGQRIAPGMFERERVTDKVRVGILRMMSMQTADGGLAMWPGGHEAWPWGTVYAAHFLTEAQIAGYEIPDEFDRQVLSYVRGLFARPEQTEDTLETQAYAAYVLALAGKPQRPAMFHLNERLLSAPANAARFHLALAWLAAGRGDLARALIPQVLPEPRAARQLNGALGSPTRDRALLTLALLAAEPKNPALLELVNRIAMEGSRHQWRSTQDVAFAVMAIGRYLRQATPQSPYDSAELLLDGKTVASAARGEPLTWTPPADLSPNAKLQVRSSGAPDSVAHIAWLQSGVPLKPPGAADSGIQIRRRFLDEHGKPLKDGIVHSGDLVQVELTVKADQPLEHVVIDDLLPAGLEIENPRLENQASDRVVRPSRKSDDEPQLTITRVDMRDDRLILVADVSGGQTCTYIYTARAVTVGNFIVPPAQAQCMYDMGICTISDTGALRILPVETAPLADTEE